MEILASAVICGVIVIVGAALLFSKKTTFDNFLEGTKDGIKICKNLLPTLIILMVSVSMLSASGFVDYLAGLIAPVCEKIGIPSEILPLVIMRPVSGSASNAMIAELFEKYGADSFAGKVASVLLGSSDTIIYVSAVYFASVGVKKTRHALARGFCRNAVLRVFFLSRLPSAVFLNIAPAVERAQERHLVRVFEVRADRHAVCEPRHPDTERRYQL